MKPPRRKTGACSCQGREDLTIVFEANQPHEQRSLQDLIDESKRLSSEADEILRKMNEVTEQIFRRVAEMEQKAKDTVSQTPKISD